MEKYYIKFIEEEVGFVFKIDLCFDYCNYDEGYVVYFGNKELIFVFLKLLSDWCVFFEVWFSYWNDFNY